MKPARILVVEDDPAIARDIRRHLARMGHSVVGYADSGPDAVRMAAELPVDLVLMDIKIEGAIDGIEAAKQICARCRTPLLSPTAQADDETLRRASLTEPAGFLLKPFEELHLRTAVELALHKAAGEERLRQSENRYAVTLSSIGDAVISCDDQLPGTFINPAASALTPRSPSGPRCPRPPPAGRPPTPSTGPSARSSASSTRTPASPPRIRRPRSCASGRGSASPTTPRWWPVTAASSRSTTAPRRSST